MGSFVEFRRIKNVIILYWLLFCRNILANDKDGVVDMDLNKYSTDKIGFPDAVDKAGLLYKKYKDLSKQMQQFMNSKSRKGASLSGLESIDIQRSAKKEEILKKERLYMNQLKKAFYGKGTIPAVDPLSTTAYFVYSGEPLKIMRQHWTQWTNCSASCAKAGTRIRSLVCREVASEDDPSPNCFLEGEVISMESLKCKLAGDCPLPWRDRFMYLASISWAIILLVIFIAVMCFRETLAASLDPKSPLSNNQDDDTEGRRVKFEHMVNLISSDSNPNLRRNVNVSHSKWGDVTEGFSNNNITSAERAGCRDSINEGETSRISDPANKTEYGSNSRSSADTPVQGEMPQTCPDEEDSEPYCTPKKIAALKRILASTIYAGQRTVQPKKLEDSEADSSVASNNSSLCSCGCSHHRARVQKNDLPSNFVKMHKQHLRSDPRTKSSRKTRRTTPSAPQPPVRHAVRFLSTDFREASSGENDSSISRFQHQKCMKGRNNNRNNNCFGLVSLNQMIFATGKVLGDKMAFGCSLPNQSITSQPKQNRELLSKTMPHEPKYMESNVPGTKQREESRSGGNRESGVAEDCCIVVIPDDAKLEPTSKKLNHNEVMNNFPYLGETTLESDQEDADVSLQKLNSSEANKCKSRQSRQKISVMKIPLRIPMRKCTRQNINKILKHFRP